MSFLCVFFSLAMVLTLKVEYQWKNSYTNIINPILNLMTLYMIKAATRWFLHGDSACTHTSHEYSVTTPVSQPQVSHLLTPQFALTVFWLAPDHRVPVNSAVRGVISTVYTSYPSSHLGAVAVVLLKCVQGRSYYQPVGSEYNNIAQTWILHAGMTHKN